MQAIEASPVPLPAPTGLGGFVLASGLAALVGGRVTGGLADRSSRSVMAGGAAVASVCLVLLVAAATAAATTTLASAANGGTGRRAHCCPTATPDAAATINSATQTGPSGGDGNAASTGSAGTSPPNTVNELNVASPTWALEPTATAAVPTSTLGT